MQMRLLVTFCVGVVALALAWQSFGDTARQMIANSYPQLSWLAPQHAIAQTAPNMVAPTTSSADPQELKEMSLDLAALRQRVDQLAAEVTARHEQIARDFETKLEAVERVIFDKISAPTPQPALAPARKPAQPLQR